MLMFLWEVCQEGRIIKGTIKMKERVILDIMDVVGRPQGSYPESLVSISLLLAAI